MQRASPSGIIFELYRSNKHFNLWKAEIILESISMWSIFTKRDASWHTTTATLSSVSRTNGSSDTNQWGQKTVECERKSFSLYLILKPCPTDSNHPICLQRRKNNTRRRWGGEQYIGMQRACLVRSLVSASDTNRNNKQMCMCRKCLFLVLLMKWRKITTLCKNIRMIWNDKPRSYLRSNHLFSPDDVMFSWPPTTYLPCCYLQLLFNRKHTLV